MPHPTELTMTARPEGYKILAMTAGVIHRDTGLPTSAHTRWQVENPSGGIMMDFRSGHQTALRRFAHCVVLNEAPWGLTRETHMQPLGGQDRDDCVPRAVDARWLELEAQWEAEILKTPTFPCALTFKDQIKREAKLFTDPGDSHKTSVQTQVCHDVLYRQLRSWTPNWHCRLMEWENNDGSLAHAPCFPIVAWHWKSGSRALLIGVDPSKPWWAVGRCVVELSGKFIISPKNGHPHKVIRQSEPFVGRNWRGRMLALAFEWAMEINREEIEPPAESS
jgi:hypothetical protein